MRIDPACRLLRTAFALAALAVVAVLAGALAGSAALGAGAGERARLAVISIDGLYPETYTDPAPRGLAIPNLLALARAGVAADGVEGVFPSTTYPSHATLITGARPARHGVTANSFFNPAKGSRDWYWFASGLRVPTLPEVAHSAGYKVASVQWPCLADAPYVDFRIPEIWAVEKGAQSSELVRRFATPGLIERIEKRSGSPWTEDRFQWGKMDDRIVEAAASLIELEKPELLLVHIIEVDHELHAWGRDSEEGFRAIERADRHLGQILDALDHAGVREATDVVVVSDHGFASIHSVLHPNVILAELGLLEPPASAPVPAGATASPPTGEVQSWRAVFHTSGSAGALYLREPTDAPASEQALRRFRELAEGRYRGLFEVLDRDTLAREGAFPGAEFGICAAIGYDLAGDYRGPFITASGSRGNHGYRPEWPEMHAAFVGAGPSFRKGLHVPLMRMIDVAPTLAHILGVELGEQAEGVAMVGLLEAKRGAVAGRTE